MIKLETILEKVVNKKPLKPEEVILATIIGDGNCFYRAVSLYLTNDQANHKIIREIIYESAKDKKDLIKPFFLSDIGDEIIVDLKLENYIEKINTNYFYTGIIEMSLAANVFHKTIIVYSIEKENETNNFVILKDNQDRQQKNENLNKNIDISEHDERDTDNNDSIIYTHLAIVEKPNENYKNLEDIIILLYDRRVMHFSLIINYLDNNKEYSKQNLINKNYIDIKNFNNEDIIKYVKNNNNTFINLKLKNGEYANELNTTKFTRKKGYDSYYEDIYSFLLSKEKAFNPNTKKINWDKVNYPSYIRSNNLTKKQKNKKKETLNK